MRSGRSGFLIVDLTFHGQWNIFPFRCQKAYNCSFAHIGNHPGLAIRKGSTVEVVLASCHYCSSNLCLQFGLYSKYSCLRIIYNFGTASYQMPSSKLVLNRDCAVQKREVSKLYIGWFCVLEGLAFLTVDFAFHELKELCHKRLA